MKTLRILVVGGSWAGLKTARALQRRIGNASIIIVTDAQTFPGGAGGDNQATLHLSGYFYALWTMDVTEAARKVSTLRADSALFLEDIDKAQARINRKPGALVCFTEQGTDYAVARIRQTTGTEPTLWPPRQFVVAPGAKTPFRVIQTTDVVYDKFRLANFELQQFIGAGGIVRTATRVTHIDSDGRVEWIRTPSEATVTEFSRSGQKILDDDGGEAKFDLVINTSGYSAARIQGSWRSPGAFDLDIFQAGVLQAQGHVSHFSDASVAYAWNDGQQSLFTSQMHSSRLPFPNPHYEILTTYALTDWTAKRIEGGALPDRMDKAQVRALFQALRQEVGAAHMILMRQQGILFVYPCYKVNANRNGNGLQRNTDVTFVRTGESTYLGLLGKASHAHQLAQIVEAHFSSTSSEAALCPDWRYAIDNPGAPDLRTRIMTLPGTTRIDGLVGDAQFEYSSKFSQAYRGALSQNRAGRILSEASIVDDPRLMQIYDELMAQGA